MAYIAKPHISNATVEERTVFLLTVRVPASLKSARVPFPKALLQVVFAVPKFTASADVNQLIYPPST